MLPLKVVALNLDGPGHAPPYLCVSRILYTMNSLLRSFAAFMVGIFTTPVLWIGYIVLEDTFYLLKRIAHKGGVLGYKIDLWWQSVTNHVKQFWNWGIVDMNAYPVCFAIGLLLFVLVMAFSVYKNIRLTNR